MKEQSRLSANNLVHLSNHGLALSRRSFFAALAAAFPATSALCAQERRKDDKDATFSADVNVVNVFATVHDKKNVIVRDLSKDDFTLTEDGRAQTIKFFARESDLALTLGLLIDTSGSQRRLIGDEKRATRSFILKVLREGTDSAFLLHFDFEAELLQDLTSSKLKLEDALDNVEGASPRPQWGGQQGGGQQGGQQGGQGSGYPGGGRGGRGGGRAGQPGGGPQGGSRGGPRGAGGTVLYDTVLLASDDLMRKQKGRKALIMLSDGVDHGSRVSLEESISAAQRADTMVYSILFEDKQGGGFPGRGGVSVGGIPGLGGGGRGGRGGQTPRPQQDSPNGKRVLERLAKETGGTFFEVTKKQSLDQVFERIEEELRNQYSFGYTSNHSNASGYRRIQLAANRKDLIVQTRDGYYSER